MKVNRGLLFLFLVLAPPPFLPPLPFPLPYVCIHLSIHSPSCLSSVTLCIPDFLPACFQKRLPCPWGSMGLFCRVRVALRPAIVPLFPHHGAHLREGCLATVQTLLSPPLHHTCHTASHSYLLRRSHDLLSLSLLANISPAQATINISLGYNNYP